VSNGCGKPGHVGAGSEEGTQWCATCAKETGYRQGDAIECENCHRHRVLSDPDGICEKCGWDNDAHEYASVSRPREYDRVMGLGDGSPDEIELQYKLRGEK
jgi:hypothetical protein